MFAQLVGNVDSNSAFVLAFLFAAVCIPLTAMIAKRRSSKDMGQEFELAKIKERDSAELNQLRERNSHEKDLIKLSDQKEIEFKRIGSGMIELQANKSNHPDEG